MLQLLLMLAHSEGSQCHVMWTLKQPVRDLHGEKWRLPSNNQQPLASV